MGTVEVGYDLDLERAILAAYVDAATVARLAAWAEKTRSAIANHRLARSVSTRVLRDMAKLLRHGQTLADCLKTFFLSWTSDERAKVGAK
jgi:type II secretory pathway component PulF